MSLVEVANIAGVVLFAMAGRPLTSIGRTVVLAVLASAALFTLSRIESGYAVSWGDVSFDIFAIAVGVALLATPFLSRRSASGSAHVSVMILVTTLVTLVNLIVHGGQVPWAAYSFVAFVGPIALARIALYAKPRNGQWLIDRIHIGCVILGALSVVSVISTTIGVGYLGWDDTVARGVTPIGGSIATGAVLLLVWPHVVAKGLIAHGIRSVLALVVLAVALPMTGSRVIVLCAGLAGIATYVIMAKSAASPRRTAAVLLMGVLFTCVAVLAVERAAVRVPAIDRLQSTFGSRGGDVLRVASVLAAAELIKSRPLIGHGAGQTYPWFRMGPGEYDVNTFVVGGMSSLVEPHNTYLMIWVEYGFVAVLLFGGLCVWTVVRLTRVGRRVGETRHVLAAVGVAAFAIQALASSHLLVNPRVAIVFWIYVGAHLAVAASADCVWRRCRGRVIDESEGSNGMVYKATQLIKQRHKAIRWRGKWVAGGRRYHH